MSVNEIKLDEALSGDQLGHIKDLFREYASTLDFDLSFQDFQEELEHLPGGYASPTGWLCLASCDDQVAGCVALRRIREEACEMKRLYVRPKHRGKRIGRLLAEAAVVRGRELGYRIMLLDTIDTMTESVALYRSLGFVETAPYRHNPIPGALFFQLELQQE